MDSSRERLIVVLSLIFGILCFIALWRPDYLGFGKGGAQSEHYVGDLKRKQGDVRRKATGEIVWHDMTDRKIRVGDGDTVYTGPTGSADLNLDIGAEATIFPNSLVVIHNDTLPERSSTSWLQRIDHLIHKKREVQSIALQSGSVHIAGLSRERPVELESQGKRYRIETDSADSKPVSVDLSVSPGNTTQQDQLKPEPLSIVADSKAPIRVISLGSLGSPAPEADHPSTRDQPGAPEASAAPVPLQTTTVVSSLEVEPARVSTRILDEEHLDYIPVKLQWKPVSGAAAIQGYHVRVFHGEQPIVDQDLAGANTDFQFKLTELDRNPYAYQVSAVLNSGIEVTSAKTPLDIEASSPRMTLPETTEPIQRSSDFLIAWERTLLASRYRVQISKDPDFKALKLDRQTALNVLPFRAREPGPLYIRVKSVYSNHESLWSAPLGFKVR